MDYIKVMIGNNVKRIAGLAIAAASGPFQIDIQPGDLANPCQTELKGSGNRFSLIRMAFEAMECFMCEADMELKDTLKLLEAMHDIHSESGIIMGKSGPARAEQEATE